MTQKNKPLDISSGVVGALFAAIVITLAIILLVSATSMNLADTEVSDWGTAIVLLFVIYPLKIFAIALAVILLIGGVGLLILALIPVFITNIKALEVFAVLTSIMLGFMLLGNVTSILRIIVHGFQSEQLLGQLLDLALFILTATWFALNISKAVVYNRREE